MSNRDQDYAYNLYATIMDRIDQLEDRIDQLEDILNLNQKTDRYIPITNRLKR